MSKSYLTDNKFLTYFIASFHVINKSLLENAYAMQFIRFLSKDK